MRDRPERHRHNGRDGVIVSAGSGLTVSGNTITGNGERGLFAAGGSGTTVSMNTVTGNGADGVFVSGATQMICR